MSGRSDRRRNARPPLSLTQSLPKRKFIRPDSRQTGWPTVDLSDRSYNVSPRLLFSYATQEKKLAQRVVLRVSTPSRAPCLPWPPFAVSFPLFVKIMCVRTSSALWGGSEKQLRNCCGRKATRRVFFPNDHRTVA